MVCVYVHACNHGCDDFQTWKNKRGVMVPHVARTRLSVSMHEYIHADFQGYVNPNIQSGSATHVEEEQ